jgi:RNase H domain-containing protein/argonaute-like protein/MID domain-containing protein
VLITLGYRLPREHLDELLGTVCAYPLTEEFAVGWSTLPYWVRPSGLAIGITAGTGKSVKLFKEYQLSEAEKAAGKKMLLVTTDDTLDLSVRTAMDAWEAQMRKPGDPQVLGELLPRPEPARAISDFVGFRPGRVPVAPDWVYRVSSWQVMAALATLPLSADGRELAFRLSTDGDLVAWDKDDVLVSPDGKSFAMARISVNLANRRGVDDLVLAFDAHVSRFDPRNRRAKKIWVERDEDGPIARLPTRRVKVGDEWHLAFDRGVSAVLAACDLKSLELPDELPAEPGPFRPTLGNPKVHAIGSGLGQRFMLRLHEHISRALPQLVPLNYQPNRKIKLPQRVTRYPAGGMSSGSVGPSGYKKVLIACLYGTSSAAQRMSDELSKLTGQQVLLRHDGEPIAVNERLSVVGRWCPELVNHTTVNRAAHLAELGLPEEADQLVAAWVETEYHPKAQPPAIDAKPHLRRLLAHLGIPTQFLATEPPILPSKTKPATAEQLEHRARAALRDLLRSAGMIDERMLGAVANPAFPLRLDRRALLVGIHARRQNVVEDHSPLVLLMTAVLVDPDDIERCRVLMYSDRCDAWVRVAAGITDFHAGALGTTLMGRQKTKAGYTRAEVDRRLADLARADLSDLPIVLFVDAERTRSLWAGLTNQHADDEDLPGIGLLAEGKDVAIVRIDSDTAKLGRPVTRVSKRPKRSSNGQPASSTRVVYKLTDSSASSWYLPCASPTLDGRFGRSGLKYNRWNLRDSSEIGDAWHSYTGRELVVVRRGSWTDEQLVALTASLCEQPIGWDGRTVNPVPLHLATSADNDHVERNTEEDES